MRWIGVSVGSDVDDAGVLFMYLYYFMYLGIYIIAAFQWIYKLLSRWCMDTIMVVWFIIMDLIMGIMQHHGNVLLMVLLDTNLN